MYGAKFNKSNFINHKMSSPGPSWTEIITLHSTRINQLQFIVDTLLDRLEALETKYAEADLSGETIDSYNCMSDNAEYLFDMEE